MNTENSRAYVAGHQARLRGSSGDYGFVSGKVDPANVYVFIKSCHEVEFGQYVKKHGQGLQLELATIPRGALSASITDAEILVAASNDLLTLQEDGPGLRFAVLQHVIEGVERLRKLIAAGKEPVPPRKGQWDFC